jgi:hypothetical protein
MKDKNIKLSLFHSLLLLFPKLQLFYPVLIIQLKKRKQKCSEIKSGIHVRKVSKKSIKARDAKQLIVFVGLT